MSNPIYTEEGIQKAINLSGITSKGFSSAFLIGITTVAEAEEAYKNAILDSDDQKAALAKWDECSENEVKQAKNIVEVMRAYSYAPCYGEAARLALEKCFSFARDLNDLLQLYDTILRRRGIYKEISLQDNELRKRVLAKLISCSKTIPEIKLVHDVTHSDEALVKWNEFSLKEIDEATTIAEIEQAVRNIHYLYTKTKETALIKWNRFSQEEVDKATAVAEFKQIFDNCPFGSESQKNAITKWISLCQTSVEIRDAHNTFAKYSTDYLYNVATKMARKRWIEISDGEIDKAKTITEIMEAYYHLPNNCYDLAKKALMKCISLASTTSELKSIVFTSNGGRSVVYDEGEIIHAAGIKWISLCRTIDDFKEICNIFIRGSEIANLAFAKWDELSLKEVNKAKIVPEIREAYSRAPNGGIAQKTALDKIYNLANAS